MTVSTAVQDERLVKARIDVRMVERYAYRLVSEALEPEDVNEARAILSLAIGLRRKLDSFGGLTDGS